MKTTEQYIEYVFTIKKREQEKAIQLFQERTGIEVDKKFGNFYIPIQDIYTDEPTRTPSLYFKYLGYGSIRFLGNINGKTKEGLRYINADIQKATENLIQTMHYINKDTREALELIEQQHGRTKTPIGVIRDRVYYSKTV